MSDIEKLFLAAYPLWPKQLLENFSSLLSLEVAKFNPEVNPGIIDTYNKIAALVTLPVPQNGVISILKPDGKNAIRSDYAFSPQTRYAVDEFGNYSAPRVIICNYAIYYDRRLFSGASASLSVSDARTGDFNYIQNPEFRYSSSPSNFFTASVPEQIKLYYLSPQFIISVTPSLIGYVGASTVLAMVQNGVSVDVDHQLISDFVDFLNAYKKYGAQLAADVSLQTEKSKQDLQQYKNSVSDKLTERNSNLNDMRLQIMFAAKNETNSAKRDMQNLALSAQSLMLQMREKIS